MEEEQKEFNFNTFARLNFLIDLSYIGKYEGTMSEIEHKLGKSRGNPDIRMVLKELRRLGILIPTATKYGFQLYKVDIIPLCKVIESQELITKVKRYYAYGHK